MGRRIPASRKIVNALLSMVLVLGLMPAPAFAGGGVLNAEVDQVVSSVDPGAANLDNAASGALSNADGAMESDSAPAAGISIGPYGREAGDISASMEPDTTAGVFDIDAAPASDGASALSEGGASLTPGWTQSGTCEWKIDDVGLLTVRPLGDGASGELADWGSGYNNAPWYPQRETIKSAVIEPGVSASTCYRMFCDCKSLSSLDLSGLDTSKVTYMGSMFSGCSKLPSLDLSGLDTSAVTGMDSMFWGCSSLTSLDLSGLDTSKVTYMRQMFYGCSSLPSLDLSSFDTSKVTDMESMFYGCSSLTTLDLSGFDTSAVTGIICMFSGCSSLPSLDLSSFDTSKVTRMVGMFSGCSSLKTIFVSRLFTTAEVGSSNRMFDGCSLLVGGAGTVYDSSFVNSARARIDGGSDDPGYFTGKHEKLDGDVNGNGILNVVDAQIVYDIATTDSYKDRQDYADMRARADVTWDDEVDASDAFAIQYAALRGWQD